MECIGLSLADAANAATDDNDDGQNPCLRAVTGTISLWWDLGWWALFAIKLMINEQNDALIVGMCSNRFRKTAMILFDSN